MQAAAAVSCTEWWGTTPDAHADTDRVTRMDDRKVRLTAFLTSYAVMAVALLAITIRLSHLALDEVVLLVGIVIIGAGLIIMRVLRGPTHRPKLSLTWLIVTVVGVPLGSAIFLQFNPPRSARIAATLLVASFLMWLFLVRGVGKRRE
jgi:hypothetical protein